MNSLNQVPKVLPGGSVVKNPPANTGDASSNPEWRRFPGKRNGNPLQYSCLENPMDREAWQATVQGVAKESDATEHTHINKVIRTLQTKKIF